MAAHIHYQLTVIVKSGAVSNSTDYADDTMRCGPFKFIIKAPTSSDFPI